MTFLWFGNTNQVIQKSVLKLDKAILYPRNKAICLKNWKYCWSPTAAKFIIFCRNFSHVSYLTMSTKGCSGFLLFCLDIEILIKM